MLIQYLRKPFKLDCLHSWLKAESVHVLDVGCGNHSPSIFKTFYPNCRYHGLDRSKTYALDERDLKCMDQFYEIDLAKAENLEPLPQKYFDCIILSHIIEHLENGESILLKVLDKLKQGGIIYLEFPNPRSVNFPKMAGRRFCAGTLNFYDDASHVKLYELKTVEKLLTTHHCSIIRSGTRRSWKRIIFFPIYFMGSLIELHNINGGLFWDMLGFADYIIAQKYE